VIRALATRPWTLACAAHALLTIVLCSDVLILGRVPYFRDVSTYYYPQYAFTASSLQQGVWPLWNPTADAGAPFLLAYPVELILLAALGARRTLMLSPPLHVWLAMCAATALAYELGWSRRSAWLSGAAFGLSGVFQSSLNLVPLSQGAAWAPLVVAAYLRCCRSPGARAAAALGALAALQASTLAGEIVAQTALFALALTPSVPTRAQWRALGGAGLLALALAAPVACGLSALLEGTSRASGFGAREVLTWSAHPLVLAEMGWPRFLGDPHTMTDLGYWGQRFFPDGYPYLISLYLGPLVLALAVCAGRQGARLWGLAAVGALFALGAHGPLAAVLPVVAPFFRAPVKFLFTVTLALALLAGRGNDAIAGGRRTLAAWCLGVPAALFLVLGAALHLDPRTARTALAAVWERLAAAEAAPMAAMWSPALVQTGLLAAVAAAALWAGRRAAFAPAACLVADLLATNARVDPSAPAAFYDLRPEVAALVAQAPEARAYRWFTYGIANSGGVRWSPALLARNEDVPLYYYDRQTLWARTKVLDGLDGAFDEDRTGWAPPGATFSADESRPARHAANEAPLRLAGVRWVLSFVPLPAKRTIPRAQAHLPGIEQGLILHELPDALPRAFWVPDCEVAPSAEAARAVVSAEGFDARSRVVLETAPAGGVCGSGSPGGTSRVRWTRESPHRVLIEAEGDAGYLVFLEGYHRNWRIDPPHAGVTLQRANARYWAVPVPRGQVAYRVRFRPWWVWPAVALAGLGALSGLMLCWWRAEKLDTSSSVALASGD
jgi:hypothetical protein